MKLYHDFAELVGQTITGSSSFHVPGNDPMLYYRTQLLVTQEHGVLFFNVHREDRYLGRDDFVLADNYPSYLFLRHEAVQYYLVHKCRFTQQELQKFCQEGRDKNQPAIDELFALRRKMKQVADKFA